MIRTSIAIAVLALSSVAVTPAWSQSLQRAWVSGHGTDAAGCGAPTVPCRSLQYAHDNAVAAGGEIDILDPAGYGAITITKAISIINDGVGTAGVQQANAGQDAIHINAASSDAVTLRGLSIDGLGTARDGVGLAKAGTLTVVNCVIRHFAHDGVHLQQSAGILIFSIMNTIAADNANDGFDVAPAAGQGQSYGVIDHVDAVTNRHNGVTVNGLSGIGISVTVANSNVSDNVVDGVYALLATVIAREDVADLNATGYYVDSDARMYLSRSEAISNFGGMASVVVVDNANGAFTFGDNALGPVSGTLTPASNQ